MPSCQRFAQILTVCPRMSEKQTLAIFTWARIRYVRVLLYLLGWSTRPSERFEHRLNQTKRVSRAEKFWALRSRCLLCCGDHISDAGVGGCCSGRILVVTSRSRADRGVATVRLRATGRLSSSDVFLPLRFPFDSPASTWDILLLSAFYSLACGFGISLFPCLRLWYLTELADSRFSLLGGRSCW